jgi:hypothetical protein
MLLDLSIEGRQRGSVLIGGIAARFPLFPWFRHDS